MFNTKTIHKLAFQLEEHPIHVKMFLSKYNNLRDSKLEEFFNSYKNHRKNNPKPFVKWVGGKRQLAKQFRSMNLYPPDEFNPQIATYHEPFVGGGAMFFDLSPQKAILSDMNRELITTYKVVQKSVEKLIKKLRTYQNKNNKADFLKFRRQNVRRLNDISIAARFIYLNRTCFNGLYRVNRAGKFNVPFGRNRNPLICDEQNLRKVSESLQGIKIFKEDYKRVLTRAKRGDFIYFDPPYYPISETASFTGYVKESFLEEEQKELRDVFLKLHKRRCYVMLSNSNTPFINKIYSGLDKKITIHKVYAGRAINSKGNKRGKIKEIVVVNY